MMFVSGFSSGLPAECLRSADLVGFLMKPYSPSQLVDRVDALLCTCAGDR